MKGLYCVDSGYVHKKPRLLGTIQNDRVILTLQVSEGFPPIVQSDRVCQVVLGQEADLIGQRDFLTTLTHATNSHLNDRKIDLIDFDN